VLTPPVPPYIDQVLRVLRDDASRQNLTIRMQVRRLTRLTNAFGKKVENLRAAMELHFTHYNFLRFHTTIRCTPAMEAGIARSPMTVKELVEMAA